MTIVGLILAGGKSRRMNGQDKAFAAFGGKTLLARALARLSAQVDTVFLSANGDPASYGEFGVRVLPDMAPGHAGPLAGILAGFDAAMAAGATHVLSIAVDTPFFPADLAARLAEGPPDEIAVAASAGRMHPVFGLWPVAYAAEARLALLRGDARMRDFVLARPHRIIAWGVGGDDPFFNINTPDDLAAAERRLAERGA